MDAAIQGEARGEVSAPVNCQAHDGAVLLDVRDRRAADMVDGGRGAQASAGTHVPGLLQRDSGVPGLRIGPTLRLIWRLLALVPTHQRPYQEPRYSVREPVP